MAGGMYGRMVCMVGACVAEGHVWQGGMRGRGPCMAGEMATAAGSMHPTGMHSHSMSKLTLNKIAKNDTMTLTSPKNDVTGCTGRKTTCAILQFLEVSFEFLGRVG